MIEHAHRWLEFFIVGTVATAALAIPIIICCIFWKAFLLLIGIGIIAPGCAWLVRECREYLSMRGFPWRHR